MTFVNAFHETGSQS